MTALYNKKSKSDLLDDLRNEPFDRTTISFYKYVIIKSPDILRDELYKTLNEINVLGRIYLSSEGINAQVSVPKDKLDIFKMIFKSSNLFNDVEVKEAVEEGVSFIKLIIR